MVKRDLIMTILWLILLTICAWFLGTVVFGTYQMAADDVAVSLSQGDQILVVKNESPSYEDLVLYEHDGEQRLGRVMGKAGDHLVSVGDVLYRNQEVVDQTFLESLKAHHVQIEGEALLFTEDFHLEQLPQVTGHEIPEGHYVVLNDNRQNTADSREFGLIAGESIKGVLRFRMYPFDRFGFLTLD